MDVGAEGGASISIGEIAGSGGGGRRGVLNITVKNGGSVAD